MRAGLGMPRINAEAAARPRASGGPCGGAAAPRAAFPMPRPTGLPSPHSTPPSILQCHPAAPPARQPGMAAFPHRRSGRPAPRPWALACLLLLGAKLAGEGPGRAGGRRWAAPTPAAVAAAHRPPPAAAARRHPSGIAGTNRHTWPPSLADARVAPAGSVDATATHDRRLAQAPTTLPACTAHLTTCKSQLATTTTAKNACATKLAACTKSAPAKQLSSCQAQVAALQAQVAALNASLAGAQAALNATQKKLDSMNQALAQRDADVAGESPCTN